MSAIILPNSDKHFDKNSNRYQYRSYERALRLIPDNKRFIALDIGAHVGYWTRAMLEDFKEVYSFEPSLENYQYLLKNCKQSNCYNIAIGEKSGFCDLADGGRGNENSGSYKTIDGKSIEVKSVDSFGIKNVSFIKVDVQGDEAKVIAGASNTIMKYRPIISVECIYEGELDLELIYSIVNLLDYKLLDISSKDYIFIPSEYKFPKDFSYKLNDKEKKQFKKRYKLLSKFMFCKFDEKKSKLII